jgi:hypothetical protein
MLAGVPSPASARTAPAFAPGLATAAVPFGSASFGAIGTGSELHLNALNAGPTTLLGLEQAFAAQSVNSTGLSNNRTPGKSALFDGETGALIQPNTVNSPSKAYGRGSGIEVGLGKDNTAPTNQNQLVFPTGVGGAKLLEATAPPSQGPVSNSLVDLSNTPLSPVVKAKALEASAATNFNNSFCPLGKPIAYGEGQAANASILNTSDSPALDVSSKGTAGVLQSKTYSWISPNSDGTFGITSRASQTILPLTVTLGPLVITVTVQGNSPTQPVTLTAKAPGEAGQGGGVKIANDHTVKVDVKNSGSSVGPFPITFDITQLISKPIDLGPLGKITVDDLVPMPGSNGSTVAGATFDLVRAQVPVGKQLVDLALGHMAVAAHADNPIDCNIPVTKTAPDTVNAGDSFTYKISVPTSANDLKDSTCDLVNIGVTDTISVKSGNPTWTVGGTSPTASSVTSGSDANGPTSVIKWTGLGPYHPGDPPIMLSITVNVPHGSLDGVVLDTVHVTASLGNCKGNTQGLTDVTSGLNGIPVTGMFQLPKPSVIAVQAPLPRTGGGGPILPWVAGGLLVLAEATRRIVRRARRAPATS